MSRFVAIAFLLLLATGCQKAIEKAQENALISAITNGRWKITSFIRAGKVITADFNAYDFQFHKNNIVDAYANNILEKTGSWQGDIDTQTITSQFSGASYPLELLNGTWKITNSSLTSVEANQTANGELRVLKLNKL